jgi:hypothetical protein
MSPRTNKCGSEASGESSLLWGAANGCSYLDENGKDVSFVDVVDGALLPDVNPSSEERPL